MKMSVYESKLRTHILKTDPEVFEASLIGLKKYEIRFNDRDFQVGDMITLSETKHTGEEMKAGKDLIFTARTLCKTVSHILSGPIYGLADGWVILSLV